MPVSVEVRYSSGVWTVHATSMSCAAVATLMAMHARSTLVVHAIDGQYDPQGHSMLSIRQIALARGIDARIFEDDIVSIRSSDLSKLLDDLSHHQLDFFDASEPPGEDELIEMFIALGTAERSGAIALDSMPLSSLLVSVHDDFYFHAETRSRELAFRLAGKSVENAVGFALLSRQPGEVEISDVPDALVEAALGESGSFAVTNSERTAGDVELVLASGYRNPLSPGEVEPPPALVVRYEIATGTWLHRVP